MNHLLSNKPIRYALAVITLIAGAWLIAGPITGGDTDVAKAASASRASERAEAARISEQSTAQNARVKLIAAATARAEKAAEAARIAKADAARLKAAAAARANRKARAAAVAAAKRKVWIRPMKGDLTSGFGYRWGAAHEGVDISNGGGTPVYAAASGTVVEAACTSPSCSHPGSMAMSGYGNKVDIQHAGGVMTRYGHLTRYVVHTGQRVTVGQLIGYEGQTGNVTGPHLHLEVHVGGEAVDPIPFFARKGVKLAIG
jgi:murein DD-endopeptidase MepM/ murein hydrolase activator NlpD